jgi:Uma2 family endonuclease
MGVGVVVDEHNTYEPGVVLLHTGRDSGSHLFRPEDVPLTVEVVSPGTKRRDRFEKPTGYAQAGIAHYWRVEMDPLHVYAHAIGLEGTYQLVADSGNLLKLDQPFDICLPVPPLGD